jgi:hypothetical protein
MLGVWISLYWCRTTSLRDPASPDSRRVYGNRLLSADTILVSENPNTRTLRDVDITPCGSRDAGHQIDRSSTGSKFRAPQTAQRIARAVLNLPDDVIFEEADAIQTFTGAMRLIESHGRAGGALDIRYLVAKTVVRARFVE